MLPSAQLEQIIPDDIALFCGRHPVPLLVIAGATATGKSAVAQWIAERSGAAIVSADSMLVYRGMDVGTAKPTSDERSRVKYIGLDCVDPSEPFSVGDWLDVVKLGVEELPIGTPVIVAGGTGLYIKALLNGLDSTASDPALRSRYDELFRNGGLAALKAEVAGQGIAIPPGDIDNPRRLIRALERAGSATAADDGIPPLFVKADGTGEIPVFCLDMPRDRLVARIGKRVDAMYDGGIVEEASRLFPDASSTSSGAIGYAEALAYSRGELTLSAAKEQTAARTRRLAKRQYTWFRHQMAVTWVTVEVGDGPAEIAAKLFAPQQKH